MSNMATTASQHRTIPGRDTDDFRAAQAETAERIAVSAASLSRLAFMNHLTFLAVLCDLAALEAWRAASESEEPEAQAEGEYDQRHVNGSGASHVRAMDTLRAAHPIK
jgi:hypothetical protein